jgi:hypothetical protein
MRQIIICISKRLAICHTCHTLLARLEIKKRDMKGKKAGIFQKKRALRSAQKKSDFRFFVFGL